MKTKGNPKKNQSVENDRFERKSTRLKSPHKDRSSKRKLSIYDEFDEDEDWDDYNYNSNDQDDDLMDDDLMDD